MMTLTDPEAPDSEGSPSPVGGGASSAETLYMMMVRTLQGEILQGAYPVGASLPSEAMLAKHFEVSRHTVRDAGLVTSRQGLGTIVKRLGDRQG